MSTAWEKMALYDPFFSALDVGGYSYAKTIMNRIINACRNG